MTADPQSWAYFRSGVARQQLGDLKRARMLYEQALAKDGTNVGALANLGILCRRAGQYEQAKAYLDRALSLVEQEKVLLTLGREQNPDWYRIKYQLAALYANWATRTTDVPQLGDPRKAAALTVRALARTTLQTLDKGPGTRGRGKAGTDFVKNTLEPFLVGTIEPPVLVLAASTAEDPLRPRPDAWPPTERPSHAAVLTGLGEAPADEAAALARIDPWPLIAFVELGPNLPPAVLFNLACFYARAYDLSTAASRLFDAVQETSPPERQALIDVAERDLVLAVLLKRRPGTIAMVRHILDPDGDPSEADTALIKEFKRQQRICDQLRADHWDVRWVTDRPGLSLTASRQDKTLLVELSDSDTVDDAMLQNTHGRLGAFRIDNPAVGTARVLLLLPEGTTITDANHGRAAQLDIIVSADSPDGPGHIEWSNAGAPVAAV